jgi:hypothetical protein
MNPEQQRIAIAEACGWRKVRIIPATTEYPDTCIGIPQIAGSPSVPDYLNDLNAMHEAETSIQCGYYCQYIDSLRDVVNRKTSTHTELLYDILHATATQRAEAFLKTIGKWKEVMK